MARNTRTRRRKRACIRPSTSTPRAMGGTGSWRRGCSGGGSRRTLESTERRTSVGTIIGQAEYRPVYGGGYGYRPAYGGYGYRGYGGYGYRGAAAVRLPSRLCGAARGGRRADSRLRQGSRVQRSPWWRLSKPPRRRLLRRSSRRWLAFTAAVSAAAIPAAVAFTAAVAITAAVAFTAVVAFTAAVAAVAEKWSRTAARPWSAGRGRSTTGTSLR